MRPYLVQAVCAGVALVVFAQPVAAQGYPTKAIRWIVPWPPGGGADVLSRMLSPHLSEALKQQIIIDNRGGAAGNIGAEMAAKSPPDGYRDRLRLFRHPRHQSQHLSQDAVQGQRFRADYPARVGAAGAGRAPVAAGEGREGTYRLGEDTAGRTDLRVERQRCVQPSHRRAVRPAHWNEAHARAVQGRRPAAIALMSGEISMILGEPATIVGHLQSGKMRALAVTSAKRTPGLPQLPTMAEAGLPAYEATSWNGMLAPAGTAADIIRRLNAEFNRIISMPDVKAHARQRIRAGRRPAGEARRVDPDRDRKVGAGGESGGRAGRLRAGISHRYTQINTDHSNHRQGSETRHSRDGGNPASTTLLSGPLNSRG